jgi:HAD superfamily hydrolase (TIGR01509 family)
MSFTRPRTFDFFEFCPNYIQFTLLTGLVRSNRFSRVSMSSPDLAAVIFDVDGTLAETERDGHRVAFNLAFREHGLDWHWDEPLYGELLQVTGGKERLAAYIRRYRPQLAHSRSTRALILDIHRTKTRHFVRIVEQGQIGLRPGIAELLAELRAADIRLAIATTTSPENVTALITSTLGRDACGWFGVIGAGDIVQSKKPDPAIYHWVLERLGLPSYTCLAIEDSHNGLVAAQAAKIRVLITRSFYCSAEDFRGAAAVIDNFDGTSDLEATRNGLIGLVNVEQLRCWHHHAR